MCPLCAAYMSAVAPLNSVQLRKINPPGVASSITDLKLCGVCV